MSGVSPNFTNLPVLSTRMEKAARLVAEDDLTDENIAVEVKISKRQLENWKQLPEFRARVKEHITQITEQILSSGYCRIDKRVELLGKNINRLESIIKAQASSDEVSGQPGAETGLIFRKDVPTRFGTTKEYSVATSILAEERAILKHIAQETGDWVERIAGNISLDTALAGLLAQVEPESESTSTSDSGDVAT